MPLPSSGQITLNQVNVELGNSGTAQIDMNSAAVRGLFGVASGQISMSNGYGKSNAPSGTGGTITTSGNYVIHTFTSSGTFTIDQSIDVEYLVVAGGGSGCNGNPGSGGGGGAGGFRTNVSGAYSGRNTSAEAAMTISAGSYSVMVGAGGASQTTAVSWTPNGWGNNGNDSSFNSIVSFGGGAGGAGEGQNGGSGGGSGFNGNAPGYGTAGQGYDGGARSLQGYAACGGGGAGSAGSAAGGGADSTGVGGAGGTGISSSIRGTATDYAGGGGGSDFNGGQGGGAGGSGGGGHGANYYQNSAGLTSGSANTGGGGGGSSETPSGAGGSGIVVIRYLIA